MVTRNRGIRAVAAKNARKREQTAHEMRQSGLGFAEIGKALGGVTATRARQIYLKAARQPR